MIFSLLLVFGERGRRFYEVPLVRFALFGAFTGLVLGLLTIPAEVGDVSPGAAGMTGIGTGLGLIAGIGSWVFCRLVTRGKTITA